MSFLLEVTGTEHILSPPVNVQHCWQATLNCITVPNTIYNISAKLGNNAVHYRVKSGRTDTLYSSSYIIADGHYDEELLLDTLNGGLVKLPDSYDKFYSDKRGKPRQVAEFSIGADMRCTVKIDSIFEIMFSNGLGCILGFEEDTWISTNTTAPYAINMQIPDKLFVKCELFGGGHLRCVLHHAAVFRTDLSPGGPDYMPCGGRIDKVIVTITDKFGIVREFADGLVATTLKFRTA